ncbi:MAG: LysR family transcriptional regulator [Tepidanaerobacteraceae bacterium]|jgi:molybdate transport system regulatory protein|nr:LysR family transcriptional regulator [Tepidanaerobacteraceae bacterium]
MNMQYKIWLENNGKVFGDGPLDILKRVEKNGSLRQTAAEINMSYCQAWNLIKTLEGRLGFKLLERHVGGQSGGGSVVTREAKRLMIKYEKFKNEVDICLNELYKKYF